MSKRINSLFLFVACIVFLSGCTVTKIPANYRFNPKDMKRDFTGNWVEVNMHSWIGKSPEPRLSGELIAIQSDSLYVLTEKELCGVRLNQINEAILYIFKDQAKKYAIVTGLLYAPDIIAALANSLYEFLLIGIPWVLTGSFISAIEFLQENKLIYPAKDQLQDFRKYARFPQGMPKGLIKEKLHLITASQGL